MECVYCRSMPCRGEVRVPEPHEGMGVKTLSLELNLNSGSSIGSTSREQVSLKVLVEYQSAYCLK